jgi:hypothetical protein
LMFSSSFLEVSSLNWLRMLFWSCRRCSNIWMCWVFFSRLYMMGFICSLLILKML